MKILLCHNKYIQRSGEDIVMQELERSLSNAGHECVQYFRTNEDLRTISLISKVTVAVSTVFSRTSYNLVGGLIRKERPDVVIVQNVFPLLSPSVYWAIKKEGLPIIQLVYNYRFFCCNGVFFTQGKICERCLKGSFLNGVIRKCYRNSFIATGVIATSLSLHRAFGTFQKTIDWLVAPDLFLKKKLVEGGFREDRIVTIRNPFDLTPYIPSYDNENYILFFGRLVREKGIFTLVEAMNIVPWPRLVIVGDGPERISLEQYIDKHRLRHVTLIGPKYGEELKAIIAGAMFVIFPSEWYDNGPMVIYQSFAMGKPVIAANIDGIPELVVEGETGVLYRPGDSISLANCIDRLTLDKIKIQRMGKQARKFAEDNLGRDVFMKAFNSLLQSVT